MLGGAHLRHKGGVEIFLFGSSLGPILNANETALCLVFSASLSEAHTGPVRNAPRKKPKKSLITPGKGKNSVCFLSGPRSNRVQIAFKSRLDRAQIVLRSCLDRA